MKQFILTMAGVFAALLLFFAGLPLVALGMIASAAQHSAVPAHAVLQLDLRRGVTDQEPDSLFPGFGRHPVSVMTVTEALRRAEGDVRVKALFVRLPEGGVEPGEADELRAAFKSFREAGKPIIVHSQGLYPSGAITSTYMLGAAADQFWMQTGAPFQATGLAVSELFFKGLFDKYGVKADFEQRYQYKNAVNGYLYDDFTPAHREAELSWMGSIYDSAIAAAAADRKKDAAALKATLEAGPYDAEDAKAKGLIDRLGQVSEAEDAALTQGGDGAKLVDLDDYASDTKDAVTDPGPVVAVVSAEGEIMTGPSDAQVGSSNINSDDVAQALRDAAKDSSVKAIVFRISSPGGSDTASEEILAAVRAAKAQKPVVVSMGGYGASGGYWVSSQASEIVAEPTTLTGSIGVFGGKLALGPALAKFGVNMRDIGVGGAYADADSPAQEFTPQQRAAFSAAIDKVYANFVGRVAEGRRLPVAFVEQNAKGRVWTGVQAKDLHLVDALGGFYVAVDRAKALAGLQGQSVRLKSFSAHHSPFDALAKAFGLNSASIRGMMLAAQVLSDPKAQAALEQVSRVQLQARGGGDVLAPVPMF